MTHPDHDVTPGTPTPAEPSGTAKDRLPQESVNTRRIGAAAVGISVLIVSLFYLMRGIHEEATDDAYIEAHVIPISSRLSAYVSAVAVDDNFHIEAGELLVELDARDYLIESNLASASLDVARGKLNEAKAAVHVASANAEEAAAKVELAQASAILATTNLARLHSVSDSRAVSSEKLDGAQAAAEGAEAVLAAARQKAVSAAAQVDLAQAGMGAASDSVKQARALLDRAKLNLAYTKIFAPVTGTVANKSVERGAFVQTGQLLCSVVPEEIYVIANFKETQLKHMQPGQKASLQVDAFPKFKLSGHVESIQRGTGSRFALLPPENATGNFIKVAQRIPVKIVFDQPGAVITNFSPGMSVEVKVCLSRGAQ